MKLLMLMMFIMAFSLADAATLHEMDFSNNPEFIRLNLKDAVRFQMFDGTHEIMLREIKPETQRVKITVFIENAPTPIYVPLDPTANAFIDVNKDKKDDLKVEVVIVQSDNAVLKITKLDSDITEEETTEEPINQENSTSKTGLIITGIIIIIGVLFYFIFRKKN